MTASNVTEGVSFGLINSNISLVIISIFGVASNVLLLVAFFKDPLKCFRNSATYLVMNLSVSDCLTCLFAPSFHVLLTTGLQAWYETFLCLLLWIGTASFVSIISVSIDRFLIVSYPIKHRILMNGKVVVLWLASIWIVSCVLPVLQLLQVNDRNNMHTLGAIISILSAVVYALTYNKLKKQSRNIALQNSNESRAQEIRILKEKRFLKTIILIASIAFICIVPSMVYFHFNHRLGLSNDSLTSKIIDRIFVCILYINSAVNPFIYVIRLPNYRKTFYMLYCS